MPFATVLCLAMVHSPESLSMASFSLYVIDLFSHFIVSIFPDLSSLLQRISPFIAGIRKHFTRRFVSSLEKWSAPLTTPLGWPIILEISS